MKSVLAGIRVLIENLLVMEHKQQSVFRFYQKNYIYNSVVIVSEYARVYYISYLLPHFSKSNPPLQEITH